jgi:EmrB/QacA subfamily drug resistance transporter
MQQWSRYLSFGDYLPLPAASKRKGYHWFVVMTVCIGAFMAALDASIVNIALPSLQKQFHVSMNTVEWVSLIYLLTLASLIVTFGRIADMFGRRWMYASGFLVFLLSSWMCGISSSFVSLLVWRLCQAVGAAMLQANSVSIITAVTPASARGTAIGIQASAQGVGLTLGPVIGGAFISYFGWRWLFYINIPIGILGAVFSFLLLPKDKTVSKSSQFDFWGFLFLTPALTTLIYVLNVAANEGWTSPVILLCMLITLIAFIAFVREESRSKDPLVDLTLFRNDSFAFGNAAGVLSYTILYAVLLLAPFFMESVLRLQTFASGMILTVIPLGMTLVTPFSGILSDRFGIRVPTVAGMGSAALGCLFLAMAGGSYTNAWLIVGLFLVGIGMGTFTPPNNSSVMGSAPSERLGVAGGILNMARTLGMGVGVTFGGMFYQLFFALNSHMDKAPEAASVSAFRYSFLIAAVLGMLTLLISAVRKQTAEPNPDYFIGDGI